MKFFEVKLVSSHWKRLGIAVLDPALLTGWLAPFSKPRLQISALRPARLSFTWFSSVYPVKYWDNALN